MIEQTEERRSEQSSIDVDPSQGHKLQGEAPPTRRKWTFSRVLSVHGLLILVVLLSVAFSIALPDTFPTTFNVRTILATNAVVAFAALAVMLPLATDEFDLSVGFVLGLAYVLTIGLQAKSGLSWELAIIVALAAGTFIGAANGLLVTTVKISSFIASLAVGTFVSGIDLWYTGGLQISGTFPKAFGNVTDWTIFSVIPAPAVYVAVVSLVLWVLLEYRPVGRKLLAVGANKRTAHLVGIRVDRYVFAAFVGSGFLASVGGVILASQLQSAQSSTGPDYLLPAFVGALLGATSVRPGRVNVGGTLIAVLLLGVGLAGLQLAGAESYVEPLFNGAALAVAVGVAGYASRRRLRRPSA
jgi:ribose transport system permease protein